MLPSSCVTQSLKYASNVCLWSNDLQTFSHRQAAEDKEQQLQGKKCNILGKQLEVQQQLQNFLNIYKNVFINKGNK